MGIVIQYTNLEFQLIDVIVFSVILELVQVGVKLRLKQKVLNDDDTLRPEDLIGESFSSYNFILCDSESWLQGPDDGEQKCQSLA